MTIGGMFESLKQRGYVVDRKYEVGEISEKTGLQKQQTEAGEFRGRKKTLKQTRTAMQSALSKTLMKYQKMIS